MRYNRRCIKCIHACSMPGPRPERTCVGVIALARGARVEIDFIARRTVNLALGGEA